MSKVVSKPLLSGIVVLLVLWLVHGGSVFGIRIGSGIWIGGPGWGGALAGAGIAVAEAAKAEQARGGTRVLNVYNWSEYIAESVLRKFEAEFGVKINYDVYGSNEEMLAKLQAGGVGLYDVVVPSDIHIPAMVAHGLLEPLDHRLLPDVFPHVLEQLIDTVFDPGNRYSVPYLWGTTGIAYDTTKVADPIRTWADMFDERYRGRILLLEDIHEVIAIGLWVLGLDPNSEDPGDILAAGDKLTELVRLVKVFDADIQKDYLLSGDIWIAHAYSGEAALAMLENPNIAYVLPADGCNVWAGALTIPRGAPSPDLAHEFINFLYRPDISAEIANAFPYTTPNKDAIPLLDEEVRSNSATYPPAEQMACAHPLIDVGDAMVLYSEVFTELQLLAGR